MMVLKNEQIYLKHLSEFDINKFKIVNPSDVCQ
jgi:hypothetical protein